MGYFHSEKNVLDYIRMADGYDGRHLIGILTTHLQKGSTLLELGMGPGVDLDILKSHYQVTGSDYSEVFLNLYKKKNEDADLLLLDAISIETDRTFDCIYSNKVLIHLTKQELVQSLKRQSEILNSNGLLFHTFWRGDRFEEHHGLRFQYYTEVQLSVIFDDLFDIVEIRKYREMAEDDSLYVIARRR